MNRYSFIIGILYFMISNITAKIITSLPGYDKKILFHQESGYLNGGNGRQLFYWFTGAQRKPEQAPLILWLNGGPGCSSLEGLFTENGPWRVQQDGQTLTLDPYAWNIDSNVIYLESPVNVGFSYNITDLGDAKQVHNDHTTVDTKYAALLDFFNQFPEFKKNKFYITGESYAGIYIPLLIKKILDKKDENKINLYGAAIGNGVYDIDILAQTRIRYAYNHGMIGYDKWKNFEKICCKSDQCDFPIIFSNFTVQSVRNNKECSRAILGAMLEMKGYNFDLYYVINPCNDLETNKSLSHECYNTNYGKYLNLPLVKKAINVADDVMSRTWKECNLEILYHDYKQIYRTMKPIFNDIVDKYNFTNIIFYNGDADIVCDFVQTQKFLIDKMNYKLIDPSTIWKQDEQTAGLQYSFKNGIKYYTVIGAGHYVPAHKPRQAIKILNELIENWNY